MYAGYKVILMIQVAVSHQLKDAVWPEWNINDNLIFQNDHLF